MGNKSCERMCVGGGTPSSFHKQKGSHYGSNVEMDAPLLISVNDSEYIVEYEFFV